jgi:hypothetical protein
MKNPETSNVPRHSAATRQSLHFGALYSNVVTLQHHIPGTHSMHLLVGDDGDNPSIHQPSKGKKD